MIITESQTVTIPNFIIDIVDGKAELCRIENGAKTLIVIFRKNDKTLDDLLAALAYTKETLNK